MLDGQRPPTERVDGCDGLIREQSPQDLPSDEAGRSSHRHGSARRFPGLPRPSSRRCP